MQYHNDSINPYKTLILNLFSTMYDWTIRPRQVNRGARAKDQREPLRPEWGDEFKEAHAVKVGAQMQSTHR